MGLRRMGEHAQLTDFKAKCGQQRTLLCKKGKLLVQDNSGDHGSLIQCRCSSISIRKGKSPWIHMVSSHSLHKTSHPSVLMAPEGGVPTLHGFSLLPFIYFWTPMLIPCCFPTHSAAFLMSLYFIILRVSIFIPFTHSSNFVYIRDRGGQLGHVRKKL